MLIENDYVSFDLINMYIYMCHFNSSNFLENSNHDLKTSTLQWYYSLKS